jgi:serine phosphatase RsbU (regulator of sigma subunit)
MTKALDAQRRATAEKEEAERRIARELEIAKDVQARLLPQGPPLLGSLTCAGTCIQARAVGGDYYDFLDLGRGRMGLVEADVAGKGIAAALLMASLQANLRSQYTVALDDLARMLSSVNRLFYDSTAERSYATLFFAEYQDGSQQLRYANCGHPAPLLVRRDGSMERLTTTSTAIGLFRDADFSVAEVALRAGDTLVVHTDGVTEASNETDEEFGDERLLELVRAQSHLPAPALLQTIVDAVLRFSGREQRDDITLLVSQCGERLLGR